MGKKAGKALTDRQAAFVREYLIDLNATQAAIRSGYCAKNPKNAEKVGPELMTKPEVRAAVQKAMDARATRVEIKGDDVLLELRKIALFDVGELFDKKGSFKRLHKMPAELRRAIIGIDVELRDVPTGEKDEEGSRIYKQRLIPSKVKLADKVRALELLGKHLKLFGSDAPSVNIYQSMSDEELDLRVEELKQKAKKAR